MCSKKVVGQNLASLDSARLEAARQALLQAEKRVGLRPFTPSSRAAPHPLRPHPLQPPADSSSLQPNLDSSCLQPNLDSLSLTGGGTWGGVRQSQLGGELYRQLAAWQGDKAWVAVVDWPSLGWLAAWEHGVDLERVIAVGDPGARAASVLGTLLRSCQAVLYGGVALPGGLRARLEAMARAKRHLLVAATWPGAAPLEAPLQGQRETAWAAG